MATSKIRTIGDILREVRTLKERATIHQALAGYLRAQYLSRDGGDASRRMSCEGAPVAEGILEEIACELEDTAGELNKAAVATLGEKYDG